MGQQRTPPSQAPHEAARIAYLLEFADTPAARAIDAIRWLAAPGPRRAAHITLAGPFTEALPDDKLAALQNLEDELTHRDLMLGAPGRFDGRTRHSVYLSVDDGPVTAAGITERDQYLPHVTLYSGRDADLAASIALLASQLPPIPIRVCELACVTVGVVQRPLDVSVFDRPPVAGWLANSETPKLTTQTPATVRLQAIDTVMQGLAADLSATADMDSSAR